MDIGTGEGLGSAAALADGTRVGRLCVVSVSIHPFPPDDVTGVWAPQGLPVH